ncbi:hypothetical protein [Streptomyces sp. MH60]|uniref:hypothetical protein n=1 Tax=Streptomyces sp. MH60 TaxID=1940758 RepID=UPI000CEE5888|nr:hypothetical protein [Streptomyces sp. MH60]PPS89590.1 hypothetical protein BZZ08_01737 [Streptomyces sp. MH60]
MTDTTVKIHFEEEPCGRCNGTGRYSYNQRDGHVCWGCSGKKVRLSRRGKTAFEAYEKALADSAATVAVRDVKPGMRIMSQAHGGVAGNKPWDYKAAWRTVATVEVTEYTGRGVENDRYVDVPCVRAEIAFEDGKSWTAESSDHPAYWNKGAFHTIYTTLALTVGGPEAQAAREEARRAIARRFKGAWLDGEEPPVPPAPRKPKSKARKPLPANLYPGQCWLCETLVPTGEGERFKPEGDTQWKVQHKPGECPQERQEPKEAPAPAPKAPQREERPAMPNKYAGECALCGVLVEAEKGERIRVEGTWAARHPKGECPPPPGPAADGTPAVLITRHKLYPEVARRGPAWRWTYDYAVNGAAAIGYGTGLESLRDMLRSKYGRRVRIVEGWKTAVPAD